MRFGTHVHHIKDNLFCPPPLFREIQKASGTTDQEMYQVYNMGHRFEVYCQPNAVDQIISISKSYNIDAQLIGRTEKSSKDDNKNHLTIKTEQVELNYG
jgi:phosphoribosylformylglycinamidine cyclo-ligase